MLTAIEALTRLRNGNHRFATGTAERTAAIGRDRRIEVAEGQDPFAIILGCSDSRVPAEIIFDKGLGDLFVIRVAGNIVAPSQVASVEFAAEIFGTRLVVVLGHTSCGAINAAVDNVLHPDLNHAPQYGSIVDRVSSAVAPLVESDLRHHRDALIAAAGRANVRASADHLRHGSAVLERLIREDGLMVVGAEYSLETGMVDFFDGA
ncbi:MAG TPA: carbonic anhydrase [Gemmatimonadales bacterium]|nr:carbonic anhydrase [Gemmatimonadales bacterium]